MSQESLQVTHLLDGLPTIETKDAQFFGFGKESERPVTGTEDGDIFFVLDSDTSTYRMDIWGGGKWNSASGENAGVGDSHKTIRHLIHFIDDGPADGFVSGAYKEIINPMFPTQIIWWESASKLKKIVEKIITRDGAGASIPKPNPIIWKMYAADGITVVATVTDTLTYEGLAVSSRTRAIS